MSFTFKKFAVRDDRCAMKVGTDGVLLGAWVDVGNVSTVLDVGAGSGLVSLMIAQRVQSDCRIVAVEIDGSACLDCEENVKNSPWNDLIEIHCCDFASITGVFDLIVSNPPFFKNDLSSATRSRTLARQGEGLNYFSLIDFASVHLAPGGRLCFVSDTRHESEIVFNAELKRLHLSRICYVCPYENKPPKRILWEFDTRYQPEISKRNLVLRDKDSMSKEYIDLTSDYYLDL